MTRKSPAWRRISPSPQRAAMGPPPMYKTGLKFSLATSSAGYRWRWRTDRRLSSKSPGDEIKVVRRLLTLLPPGESGIQIRAGFAAYQIGFTCAGKPRSDPRQLIAFGNWILLLPRIFHKRVLTSGGFCCEDRLAGSIRGQAIVEAVGVAQWRNQSIRTRGFAAQFNSPQGGAPDGRARSIPDEPLTLEITKTAPEEIWAKQQA